MRGRPRPRTAISALVLAVVVGGVAYVASRPHSAPPRPGGAAGEVPLGEGQALLAGVVSDDVTKAPIPGARVAVDHAGGRTEATTDGAGRYRAVVEASRPVAVTVDAPDHRGMVAFAKLCPGERRAFSVALRPVEPGAAPPAPVILGSQCGPGSPATTATPATRATG